MVWLPRWKSSSTTNGQRASVVSTCDFRRPMWNERLIEVAVYRKSPTSVSTLEAVRNPSFWRERYYHPLHERCAHYKMFVENVAKSDFSNQRDVGNIGYALQLAAIRFRPSISAIWKCQKCGVVKCLILERVHSAPTRTRTVIRGRKLFVVRFIFIVGRLVYS